MKFLPEWENHKASYQEYGGENNKQGVAGLSPSSITEHFSRLQIKQKQNISYLLKDKLNECLYLHLFSRNSFIKIINLFHLLKHYLLL